jgi:hypothetical protein
MIIMTVSNKTAWHYHRIRHQCKTNQAWGKVHYLEISVNKH